MKSIPRPRTPPSPTRRRTFLADVFFGGSLVERFYLVYVDGGWAYVPSPKNTRADRDDATQDLENAVWSWSTSYQNYPMAKVINSIANNDLDDYLQRAGITVEQ